MVEICPTAFYDSVNVWYNVYVTMIVMTVTPFLLLLVLNIIIMAAISRRRRMKQLASIPSMAMIIGLKFQAAQSHNLEPATKMTGAIEEENEEVGDDSITMVMVVVMFLACNLLSIVINVYESFFHVDAIVINIMSDVSNFLVIANSSVNFVIYVIFCRPFSAALSCRPL